MQVELLQVLADPGALFRPDRPAPSYPALPRVGTDQQSSLPGVYLAGDVAGTPLLKLGLNEGHDLVQAIGAPGREDWDLIVVGTGPAGFGALLAAREKGLRALGLEASHFASTVRNMTRGKVLFAEPHGVPLRSSAWLEDGCTREDLLERWQEQRAGLDIREHEPVRDIRRVDGGLTVVTDVGSYRAAKVVLAIGKTGNPRRAGVPGETEHGDRIDHFLSDPRDFQGKNLVIYGGGDVAVEAALALCPDNTVTLVTIDPAFVYPKQRNASACLDAFGDGRVDVRFSTSLVEVGPDSVVVEGPDGRAELPCDHLFEMIGAELPTPFFRKVGIAMSGDWSVLGRLGLIASMLVVYGFYALKSSSVVFPFTLDATPPPASLWDWVFHPGARSAAQASVLGVLDGWTLQLGLVGHNAWYALLYSVVVAVFGIRAARRWGRHDPHQYYRYASIIFFQLFFFVMIEGALAWFLGTIGPEYGKHYWRGWGIAQPFPLFYNTFFWWYDGDPLVLKYGFVGSGLFLTFVAIPLFVRSQGLRFCTWICGCGGLAETLGDSWRHLSPKGARSRLWEFQATLILVWSFGSAAAIVLFFQTHGNNPIWETYAYLVDFWLIAVLPIGFYPFFGGKMWCRYWCPLANYMKLLSGWYGTLRIVSNDKCISCTQCSLHCQVGVDVMAFAKNEQPFDNTNSSCIHCGICVAVCPVDVLSFDNRG